MGDTLRVVELASGNVVAEVSLLNSSPQIIKTRPRWFRTIGDQLLIVRNEQNARVLRIQLGGPATAVIDVVPFPTEGTADLAFDTQRGRIVLPASTTSDGLRVVQYGGDWSVHCGPGTPNSSGAAGTLAASGSLVAGAEPLVLDARELPRFSFGLFAVSRTPDVAQPATSQGTLCLGGSILRLVASVQNSGLAGRFTYAVSPTGIPLAGGAPQAGETLYFQAWFRDANPGPTSNFTEGIGVTLR